MCYRNNLKMEEVVITCEDFYNLPSRDQVTQAMVKQMEQKNDMSAEDLLKTKEAAEKFLNGKFTCAKIGFKKGCMFVTSSEDFKMDCHDLPIFPRNGTNSTASGPLLPSLQYSVEAIIREFSENNATTLPVKECFCDTDRCNSGNKPRSLLATFISLTIVFYVFFQANF